MNRAWLAVKLVVLAGIAAVLIQWVDRYGSVHDFSRAGRNTLSESSARVLDTLDGPVTITALVPDQAELHQALRSFFRRYQHHKPDISLRFEDPRSDPQAARASGARLGEIVVAYDARHERVTTLDEATVTNALARLARGEDRFIAFLTGNGERDIARQGNHDISEFAAWLEQRGLGARPLALGEFGIPHNIAALVIASPRAPVPGGDLDAIKKYVDDGGNVLWLTEPDAPESMRELARHLGVAVHPGTVVDPVGLTRFRNAAYAVRGAGSASGALEGFDQTVVFPYAAALAASDAGNWRSEVLARTAPDAWTETGTFDGQVAFDVDHEISGALDIALSRVRTRADSGEQRVVIIGDGDFIANAYVDNLGNREFARRLIEWLAIDDSLVTVEVRAVPDQALDLDMWQRMLILAVFGVVVPLGFLLNGTLLWWRRRRA